MPKNVEDGRILVFLAIGLALLAFHWSNDLHLDHQRGVEQTEFFWSDIPLENGGGLWRSVITQGYSTSHSLKEPTFTKGFTRENSITGGSSEASIKGRIPPHVTLFFFQPLPVNEANEELLSSIRGIGPTLAARIVKRRERHGPFSSQEDLLAIDGIGQKKLAAIAPHLTFSAPPTY